MNRQKHPHFILYKAYRKVLTATGLLNICYKNILSLLWENLVFSSWDFFSSRCFCASSKRFTCRSSSRSNGLLSTGVFAFSFTFSFIFLVCKFIRDSARFDSWLQEVQRLRSFKGIKNEFNTNDHWCNQVTLTKRMLENRTYIIFRNSLRHFQVLLSELRDIMYLHFTFLFFFKSFL